MNSPKFTDIPGMLDVLAATAVFDPNKVQHFVDQVWASGVGSIHAVPVNMTVQIANEIASKVLEYRQRVRNGTGTVEVKKVAEIRGSRFNTGKLRMDLIDPLAMEGLAAVLTRGAVKYSAHNWRDGLPYMEIIASMQRHIMAISRGEDVDSETGLPHADHVQCNAMFLSNMMKTRKDMDDRWKPKVDAS